MNRRNFVSTLAGAGVLTALSPADALAFSCRRRWPCYRHVSPCIARSSFSDLPYPDVPVELIGTPEATAYAVERLEFRFIGAKFKRGFSNANKAIQNAFHASGGENISTGVKVDTWNSVSSPLNDGESYVFGFASRDPAGIPWAAGWIAHSFPELRFSNGTCCGNQIHYPNQPFRNVDGETEARWSINYRGFYRLRVVIDDDNAGGLRFKFLPPEYSA